VRPRLERVGLIALMGVVALNIWTGAPLLGLWVGSRVAPESGISMLAVAAFETWFFFFSGSPLDARSGR
jgi:hypothetical protein